MRAATREAQSCPGSEENGSIGQENQWEAKPNGADLSPPSSPWSLEQQLAIIKHWRQFGELEISHSKLVPGFWGGDLVPLPQCGPRASSHGPSSPQLLPSLRIRKMREIAARPFYTHPCSMTCSPLCPGLLLVLEFGGFASPTRSGHAKVSLLHLEEPSPSFPIPSLQAGRTISRGSSSPDPLHAPSHPC